MKNVNNIWSIVIIFLMLNLSDTNANLPSVMSQGLDDLRVSEIFYMEANGGPQLQFIEVYNVGTDMLTLSDYQIDGLPVVYGNTVILAPGESAIYCYDADILKSTFNITSDVNIFQWTSGALSYTGQTIRFLDNSGNAVKEVTYSSNAPFPEPPNDVFTSIILCNPNESENLPSNWQLANFASGNLIDAKLVYGDPHQLDFCSYNISEIRPVDADGVNLFTGRRVLIEGIVYGINARTNGLLFTIIDEQGDGFGIFSNAETFGYSVTEGDKVRIRGVVNQFNGLSQLSFLRSIELLDDNQSLLNPVVVNQLDESSESRLVKLENVTLADPDQWTNSGNGFNVTLTNGIDNFQMRIIRNSNIFGRNAPKGTFDVVGIGGQFDNSQPYTSGYQIIPRYIEDINPFDDSVPEEYPFRTIPEVTTVDAEGVADSLDIKCRLEGIVYGVNLRPQGLQFTIIDEDNNGIGVFKNNTNLEYTVTEGDRISIKGIISQFNGLAQISPDSIQLLSTNNDLVEPKVVTAFQEDDESSLVKVENLTYVDQSQWLGNGGSFNVTMTNGTKEFVIRIDNDAELSSMPAPTPPFNITGILGQFDNMKPYDSGYQLFPRYKEDIETVSATDDVIARQLQITPNPTKEYLEIKYINDGAFLQISDIEGRYIKTVANSGGKFYVGDLAPGWYIATMNIGEQIMRGKFVKID